MAIKKSELYSSLWAVCDELRGGMDASYLLSTKSELFKIDNRQSTIENRKSKITEN